MKRQRPEQAIQRAVVGHLRARARPGVVWFHVPNERKQSPRQGAEFKRQGVLAGVSDLILLYDGKAFALELKAGKNGPTVAQGAFIDAFNNSGGYAAWASGVDAAVKVLQAWSLIR